MSNASRVRKRRCIEATIKVSTRMVKLWGRGMIGFALVRAFYTDEPWITAAQVAKLVGCSEDTAKRKLEELAGAGRALAYEQGGGKRYSAPADLAEQTYQMIRSLNDN